MRRKIQALRLRQCHFEILEIRQVLSATLGAESLSVSAAGYMQLQLPTIHAAATAGPTGFTPAQIQKAYGVDTIMLNGGIKGDGKGQTIAIVDPNNAPTITADLHTFDLKFGLPDPPSFKIVNVHGSTNPNTLPLDDVNSAVEIALDVEWSHAIAPAANILLVEVADLSSAQLLSGDLYARSQPGVVVVSNSWGGGEGIGEAADDYVFTTPAGHAGETFVFSAGDTGGPASYPAASPNVLSVGGTTLKLSSTGSYSSEVVWNDAKTGNGAGGGGLSSLLVIQGSRIFSFGPLENTPSYQKDLGLVGRATPDVTFNADPLTGFSVIDSFTFGAKTPWQVIGGTSAGAPIWSALIAIADQGRQLQGKNSLSNAQVAMYSLPRGDFHDITVGNNDYQGLGLGITGNAAGPGYDLASGLGSPFANLVVRDLVAFNGSTFVSSSGGSANGGGNSSPWFPFAKGGVTLGASLQVLDDSAVASSNITLTATIEPSTESTNFASESTGALPEQVTEESATVDSGDAQRVAAAFDDGMLHTSHSGRHQFDEAMSVGLTDDLFAKF